MIRLTTLLIISVFLFPANPGWGEGVSQVGLVCEDFKKLETTPIHRVFWLLGDGKLQRYYRDVEDDDKDGDTAEFFLFERSANYKYTVYEQSIYIKDRTSEKTSITIDRYTLIKTLQLPGYAPIRSKCEVFKSKSEFMSRLGQISASIRNMLNQRKL